jgi:YD repeat-containing protein
MTGYWVSIVAEDWRWRMITPPKGDFSGVPLNAEGQKIKYIDRAGRETQYAYDELGRLIKTTYPDGAFTTTTYDAIGQVIAVSDERNNVTHFEYDAAGHRIKIKNALNEETTYSYDQAGNRSSIFRVTTFCSTSVLFFSVRTK